MAKMSLFLWLYTVAQLNMTKIPNKWPKVVYIGRFWKTCADELSFTRASHPFFPASLVSSFFCCCEYYSLTCSVDDLLQLSLFIRRVIFATHLCSASVWFGGVSLYYSRFSGAKFGSLFFSKRTSNDHGKISCCFGKLTWKNKFHLRSRKMERCRSSSRCCLRRSQSRAYSIFRLRRKRWGSRRRSALCGPSRSPCTYDMLQNVKSSVFVRKMINSIKLFFSRNHFFLELNCF